MLHVMKHARLAAAVLCLFIAGARPAAAAEDLTSRDILLNTLLPGYAQMKLGQFGAGAVYMVAVPLNLAGAALQSRYLARVFRDPALMRSYTDESGSYYLYYLDGIHEGPHKWEFYLGTILSLYGTLLSTQSQYEVANHIRARRSGAGVGEAPPRTTVSFGHSLVAPWQPRNLINLEVLPVFALSILPDASRLTRRDVAQFFARDSVPFLGSDVSPAAGLALAAGSAVLIAQANAVWEEIAYRGVRLAAHGVLGSSVRFGLAHLPNAAVPNARLQDTAWQSVFATMFGLYAGVVTERNNGDHRKAVAWHFWNNVLAFTLNYLVEPDNQFLFGIGIEMQR
jgi:membrane protease YdiL (CAAX protease family)